MTDARTPAGMPVSESGVGEGIFCARLSRYGVLSVAGADARAFLHAQLTNDVAQLEPGRARLAGWCSAKGRLLANFAVVPQGEAFLLVVARDLAAAVAKRLAMFVLRSKVKVADASDTWGAVGAWGAGAASRLAALGLALADAPLAIAASGTRIAVRLGSQQCLVLAPAEEAEALAAAIGGKAASEDDWALLEIRSGRALITQATQDQFVPQMVNLEAIGGVDFKKGCYPGQEIVARTQYRGQLKRRMVRARAPAGLDIRPGQDLYSDDSAGQASGTVVNVAPSDGASELLAVAPIAALEARSPIRTAPGGAPIEVLALPYAA
jgi:folate-binding protein YgfZ